MSRGRWAAVSDLCSIHTLLKAVTHHGFSGDLPWLPFLLNPAVSDLISFPETSPPWQIFAMSAHAHPGSLKASGASWLGDWERQVSLRGSPLTHSGVGLIWGPVLWEPRWHGGPVLSDRPTLLPNSSVWKYMWEGWKEGLWRRLGTLTVPIEAAVWGLQRAQQSPLHQAPESCQSVGDELEGRRKDSSFSPSITMVGSLSKLPFFCLSSSLNRSSCQFYIPGAWLGMHHSHPLVKLLIKP